MRRPPTLNHAAVVLAAPLLVTVALLIVLLTGKNVCSFAPSAPMDHAPKFSPRSEADAGADAAPPADLGREAAASRECLWYGSLGLYDRADRDFEALGNRTARSADYGDICLNHGLACMTVLIRAGRAYVTALTWAFQSRHRSTLLQIREAVERFDLPDAWIHVDLSDGGRDHDPDPDHPWLAVTKRVRGDGTDYPGGNAALYPDFTFLSWPESTCPGEKTHSYRELLDQFEEKIRTRPWESRRDDLFWRGSSEGRERQLAIRNVKGKSGVDMKFMRWTHDAETGKKKGATTCTTLKNHCDHRYLAYINGITYSSRLKYLLLCGSTVLSSRLDWIEWWSAALAPGVHYVPLSDGWADFDSVWNRTRSDPAAAAAVAQNGREFAAARLTPDAAYCYWMRVLTLAGRHLPVLGRDEPLPYQAVPLEDVLFFPLGKQIGRGGAFIPAKGEEKKRPPTGQIGNQVEVQIPQTGNVVSVRLPGT